VRGGTQTFFSTDVVKYQDPEEPSGDYEMFSSIALYRWLQVTLPLTVVTLLVAWLVYRHAKSATESPEMEKQAWPARRESVTTKLARHWNLWRASAALPEQTFKDV
jgi:hypothetical protein